MGIPVSTVADFDWEFFRDAYTDYYGIPPTNTTDVEYAQQQLNYIQQMETVGETF